MGVRPDRKNLSRPGTLYRQDLPDAPGTVPTVFLSVGVEDLPLMDDCADLVLCRNALEAVQPGRYLAVGAPSSPDAWSLPARAFSRSAAS